jgi:CheY-like chemotaxis protein
MSDLIKILHVEDDEQILELTEMALALIGGLEVAQAPLGETALEIVADVQPQLILSDVQMPGLTGPETVAAIRAMPGFANIPAVFMTAKAAVGDLGLISCADDLGVITKPFDPMTLADELRALWETRIKKVA